MAKMIKSACKKTGKRLLKLWGAVLSFFLGISGMNCPLYGMVEYGMPHAEFTINGKVISNLTKESIPGILVSVSGNITLPDESNCYTDIYGDYSVTFATPGAIDMEVTLSFEDIDGAINGTYNSKEVIVTINQGDFIDDNPENTWDQGTGSKTEDVELDPPT